MEPLRVIFMGTAEIACPSLAALCASPGVSVVAVVTQPDRPKGRDLKVQPCAVKQLAAGKGLPVLQPERARRPDRRWLARALRKEFATALLLGGACGGIVGLVAWFWRGHGTAAGVIGGSIAASMLVACLIGLAVPAALHQLKLSPKIAAGPVSLALADVFTVLVYFNLAKLVL